MPNKERKNRAERLEEIARQDPPLIDNIRKGLQAERVHGLISLRKLMREQKRKKQ
ncbi:MAG: hypothetical protein UR98_C0003G0019 [Parcubacteria group bacterium GW2011_GWA1_36_12]|nr:MAG: hypothetical protein UR98_C0003G0019 [Parcubacteria group bacterium GW2011_GWA1_36_12]